MEEQHEIRVIRGILFTFLWYFSIWTGFLFVCCPLWIFILLWPKIFVPLMSAAFSAWEMYPVALMNLICQTKIRITGDKIDAKETSILIVNHRTRVDWNFLWAFMYYGCEPRSHKMIISLKSSLRHVPSLGWVMQVANCLYLHRRWDKDEITMKKQLKYFQNIGQKFQMLLFPEGTDLTVDNLRRSNEYAAKKNFEPYTNVLHPRTTGFVYFVDTMKNLNSGLSAIYDLTLAYSGSIPQTEKHFLMGNFPKVVNFHVTRYSLENLPDDTENMKSWINARWKEKEKRLIDFSENGIFPGPAYTSSMENALHLAFFFWTLLLLAMFYLFFTNALFFWWSIIHACLFVGISCTTDGYQQVCVLLDEYRRNNKKVG